ncbi:uncharacterized protein IL334_001310 [Kwoniella shivajii]|uniref:Mediator of RNA polymerase II transcription subunit 7 n=1 Tax=Kwoniella shivajii TaxID=564305 RepID=A0ABZ1CS68_9TREE|nr:hypothetical protein IL334_001310 [Kwoniella shivajii]
MSGPPSEEEALPITNTLFPPPPVYWQSYTSSNIGRYESLTGTSIIGKEKGKGKVENGIELDLNDEEKIEVETLKGKLEKPIAGWVEEDGRWMCFGNMYTTKPEIPTVESIGIPKMFHSSPSPQESLPTLLSSFLHTILLLLDVLTSSARTPDELMHSGWAHEGDQYIQHLSNLAATMMITSNQLRQTQSESTLVMMMEKEVEERKKQTDLLKRKCKEIAGNIRKLKMRE